jgi:hypothetical protein
MTMARGFLSSIDSTSANIETVSQRSEEVMRTNLTVLETNQTGHQILDVTLQNTGQTKLSEFSKWDVIVHYTDSDNISYVTWLPYTTDTPGDNEWQVKELYTSTGSPEVFEPNIFNAEEQMLLEFKVSPGIKAGSVNQVLITTPNGVTITKTFVGE